MSEPTIGDNSQLKAIVERIEHVEGEIKDLQTGKSEIYLEAKSAGLDVKVIRRLVAIRKQDQTKREEAEAILALYMTAMGMAA